MCVRRNIYTCISTYTRGNEISQKLHASLLRTFKIAIAKSHVNRENFISSFWMSSSFFFLNISLHPEYYIELQFWSKSSENEYWRMEQIVCFPLQWSCSVNFRILIHERNGAAKVSDPIHHLYHHSIFHPFQNNVLTSWERSKTFVNLADIVLCWSCIFWNGFWQS